MVIVDVKWWVRMGLQFGWVVHLLGRRYLVTSLYWVEMRKEHVINI